ncbi:MAG TPA: hypothetical protein VH396_00695 [Chitinophagaceae bacterium]
MNTFLSVITKPDEITIDSSGLNMFDNFAIAGKYKREASTEITPDFNSFITNQWDEEKAVKPSHITLYDFPSDISTGVKVQIKEGTGLIHIMKFTT